MDKVCSIKHPFWRLALGTLLILMAAAPSATYQSPSRESAVATIKEEAAQLEEQIKTQNYARAAEVGDTIWRSVQASKITGNEYPELGTTLAKVADLYGYYGYKPTEVQVLKFIAAMPDARTATANNRATNFEWTCSRLGITYFRLGCHRSSIFWLRQAIDFAKNRKLLGGANRGFVLSNYWTLCNAYFYVGPTQAELQCHREALEVIGDNKRSQDDLLYVASAGLAELRYGDSTRGTQLLKAFREGFVPAGDEQAHDQMTVYVDEGNAYISKGQYTESMNLADEGLAKITSPNFSLEEGDKYEMTMEMYGLKARALIKMARYTEAQQFIYKALGSQDPVVPAHTTIDNCELLADLARIYVHLGQFDKAYAAYISLARHYGQMAGDFRSAPTPRSQIRWVSHQSAIVQELTSVWVSTPESELKRKWEPEIGNALLQVKATLLLALTERRMEAYHQFNGLDAALFVANREYAQSARKALDEGSEQAWMDLEDALMRRENIEANISRVGSDFVPAVAEVFAYDFRHLLAYSNDISLLDYTFVDFCYPKDGQRQTARKQIVVGTYLDKNRLNVINLGTAEELSAKVRPFLEDVGRVPNGESSIAKVLDEGREVYRSIIGPFGPLPHELVFAPEGFLSNVPFAALVKDDHFLIEDHDISINHSLLEHDNLFRNQHNSNTADVYENRVVALVGDPDYASTSYPPLPGTRQELEQVQRLIDDLRKPANSIGAEGEYIPTPEKNDVLTYFGPKATATAIRRATHPLVLHIAAHGEFWPGEELLNVQDPPDPIDWASNPELLDAGFSKFDEALLRSSILLSPDVGTDKQPAGERQLTALELSSLNLLGSQLLILSACDTGLGTQSRGAGVLGFQYAVQSTMVRNALLSLWQVPDQVAPRITGLIYENWLVQRHSIARSYTLAMRQLCRDKTGPVHPFYWASFILIEQEY